MIRFVLFITVGCMAAGLVLAWAMHKAKPHCQGVLCIGRCGTRARVARCPVCGLWLCRTCKPLEGTCAICCQTEDGKQADKAENMNDKV